MRMKNLREHKPNRFAKADITKIVNQVEYFEYKIHINKWIFICHPFPDSLALANETSFI